MRPTFTSISTNNNNSLQKTISSCFNPTPFRLYDSTKNFIYFFSPPNIYGWDKYKNLYNQIITKDKTAINSYKKSNINSFEYKPSISNITIILNEENDKKQEDDEKDNESIKKKDNDNNNDYLGNKRKRSNNNNKISESDSNKSTKLSNDNENQKKNMGRKKKEEIFKGNHTKFTDDNVIRKIKCHFLNYINNTLNSSLINKKDAFLKLDNFVNENLKKDYNLQLMNQTIKEIYYNSKISSKYKKQSEDINKSLINKIYLEKNEIETIKILEQTYIELFNKLKQEQLDNFCEEIIKKEVKNGLSEENANVYLNRIKVLCQNYKEWFEKKIGRRGKNGKNKFINCING